MDKVLKRYLGIMSRLETLTIKTLFLAFYYRLIALINIYITSVDNILIHLSLLIKLLEVEFKGLYKTVFNLLKNKIIKYKYIWAIF